MIADTQRFDAATERFTAVAEEPVGSCHEFVADGPEDATWCDAPTLPGTDMCEWHLRPGDLVETDVRDAPIPEQPPFYPLPTSDFELSQPVDNPFRVLVLTSRDVARGYRWISDVLGSVLGSEAYDQHPVQPLLDELAQRLEITP
jgi:hypothetical protein